MMSSSSGLEVVDRYELEVRIKSYIKDDGRSQAAVARKLGYSPDTFNKWVRGVNRIPSEVLAQFCALLALNPQTHAELLQLSGYQVPTPTVGAAHLPPNPGILFATQIMPDGRAVNPGTIFPTTIADLYAVFPSRGPLPGTTINVTDPEASAYYAYLKIKADSNLKRLGWRWYHNGTVVNDFEMDVRPGSEVWLQRFDYESDGIFSQPPFGRGNYRIVILLGGNPAISAELTITK